MWPIGDIANLCHCSLSLSRRLSESPVTPGLPSPTADTPIRAIQLINAMQISKEMRLILTSLPSAALLDSNLSFLYELCIWLAVQWLLRSGLRNIRVLFRIQFCMHWRLHCKIVAAGWSLMKMEACHNYAWFCPWTHFACVISAQASSTVKLGTLLLFEILSGHIFTHIWCSCTNFTFDFTQVAIMAKVKELSKVPRDNLINIWMEKAEESYQRP